MNKILGFILIIFSIALFSCKNKGYKKVNLYTLEDTISYCIGTIVGEQIHFSGDAEIFKKDKFYAGLNHAFDSSDFQISKSERRIILENYNRKKQKEKQEVFNHRAEENLDKGKEFLDKNKDKEGVKVTKSGLQYKIIKMGKGRKPKLTDEIKFHYHGTMIDGTVFDSSIDMGKPIEYPLKGLIKGWQEGIQMMPVGSEWILYIPHNLGYGKREMGNIGPNSRFALRLGAIPFDERAPRQAGVKLDRVLGHRKILSDGCHQYSTPPGGSSRETVAEFRH